MRVLTTEEILACARGMRQASETNLGLELQRFSEAEAAFYAYSEGATVRARCTAGVAVCVETDSDRLDVSLRLGVGARACSYVDLYVDDLFVGTGGSLEARETIEASFQWPTDGTRRVALYLPHCRQAGIVALALADGASFTPSARPVLLALGDSITQGMDSPHPSLTWPAVAARALNLDVHNCGIGGHVFDADGLPERPVEHPALVTVAYGANDWNQGRSPEYARPYLARVRQLYPTTPLAVLETIWWEGGETVEKHGLTFAAYRTALAAIAAEFAVDGLLPMPRLLPPGPAFLADSVHPTAAGHVVMGLNVAGQVCQLVRV
ncbi:MAG: GDSL-like Lipase/Acylhydrolase [bacterium ADurb.Bin429]|nr:MAG: GDSL-like Lipase/Acylhydrolase [bacterium ADurb.Bin429]